MMEAVDRTLWQGLPRMRWAPGRPQGVKQNAVRLPVKYQVWESLPRAVAVTPGKECERRPWEQAAPPGGGFHAGDRYQGEDCSLPQRLTDKKVSFLVRLRQTARWPAEPTLTLSPAEEVMARLQKTVSQKRSSPRDSPTAVGRREGLCFARKEVFLSSGPPRRPARQNNFPPVPSLNRNQAQAMPNTTGEDACAPHTLTDSSRFP
jgi:hypothetical protein